MGADSSDNERSSSPVSKEDSTPPSSPPSQTMDADFDPEFATIEEKALYKEEQKAQAANLAEERSRRLDALKKQKQAKDPKADKEAKARELDNLLAKCASFSEILTKKTESLGRIGSDFDGQALGDHSLVLSKQPKCMMGGTMRDYQLEGLTWMYEICGQGMSGILADEMGLGKTIQTISLLAKLREEEDYMGPHLIVAPLSTLSNWVEEFNKWVPSVPVTMYHGTPPQRRELFSKSLKKNIDRNGKATAKFPVVLTTPEIVIRDVNDLAKINWEMIIIDEGHRLKNSESKLFRILRTFTSITRFLITGTPLQNNLKELWSLLNFLLPGIFQEWEQFESWFDFSDLQDEAGTEEFLQDKMKQDLVKKMHLILQPLLLRRIKADVEHMLPKKREYVLFAPMTKEQTDLYNVISDKTRDTRAYLEDKVVERLTGMTNTPAMSCKVSPSSLAAPSLKMEDSDSDDDAPLASLVTPKRGRGRPKSTTSGSAASSKASTPEVGSAKRGRGRPSKNAFEAMMKAKPSAPTKEALKRKAAPSSSPAPKSIKSSRNSTPGTSTRGRRVKSKRYEEAHTSDEEALSDDEFEQQLAQEYADKDREDDTVSASSEELERAKTLELAKKEISNKKLGNPIMQLRLVCNSPHNFYNPFTSDIPVDSTLVTSSGKMLLLDRLLPAFFARNSKVLIFSQFKTQLDILEDYARDLRNWPCCRIDGSVAQEERQRQIRDFNEEGSDTKLFLLSTRAGGQGINLASADTVILYDSDWNPQQDLQAQDRAHRIGQKRPVVIYRLATKGTVEESLLLSADAKRRLEKLVIKKGAFKSMDQKKDNKEDDDEDEWKKLLLKDGEVFRFQNEGLDLEDGQKILSEQDLDELCDRSPEAYLRAEEGRGDGEGFRIVETKVGGLMMGMEGKKGRERKAA